MRKLSNYFVIVICFLLFSFKSGVVIGSETSEDIASTSDNSSSRLKSFIQHHLIDSYDFELFENSETGKHYGFPLPIILWDDGLHVFLSSKFDHGRAVAESKGNYYKIDHGKIYRTTITGEVEHKPFDFSITKNVFMIFIVCVILFILFRLTARNYSRGNSLPSGIGRLLEPLVIFVRDEIAIPNIGEKYYKKYMSYLLTLFFFIWLVNLFGLTPLGVNVTNNIAVTFSLALITYLIITFTAKKDYWLHIFWMPGVPVPMKILLAPIELLGTFIKPFSLMIRLFANITAGHIVIMSILGMIFIFQSWLGGSLSFLLSVALGLLELLVAALQAYIFTMLSALYFGMAVEEHSH